MIAYSANPGLFRVPPFKLADKLACDAVMKFTPCPMLPDQGAAVVAFAALVPGAAAAAGQLLDFETRVDAFGVWSQHGSSCVPRPLPAWGEGQANAFYQLVQQVIGDGSEGAA